MIKAIFLIILMLQPTPYLSTDSIVWPSAEYVNWGSPDHPSGYVAQVMAYMESFTIHWQTELTFLVDFNEQDSAEIERSRMHYYDEELGIKSIKLTAILLQTKESSNCGLKASIPVKIVKYNKNNEPILYQISDTPWYYIPRGNRHYFFNWLESAEQFLAKKGPVPYDEPFPYRIFDQVLAERPIKIMYYNNISRQEKEAVVLDYPVRTPHDSPNVPASILVWRMEEGKILVTMKAEDYLENTIAKQHYELVKALENKHFSRHKLKEVKIEDGFVIYRREAKIREGMTY